MGKALDSTGADEACDFRNQSAPFHRSAMPPPRMRPVVHRKPDAPEDAREPSPADERVACASASSK